MIVAAIVVLLVIFAVGVAVGYMLAVLVDELAAYRRRNR